MSYAAPQMMYNHPVVLRFGKRRGMSGLGSVAGSSSPGPFHAGQVFVAGFSVVAPGDGTTKRNAIVAAVSQHIHGTVTESGWGPLSAAGIPSGEVWVKFRTSQEGITGAQVDSSLVAAAAAAGATLGGRVVNTHASISGGLVGGSTTPTTPGTAVDTSTYPGLMPGMTTDTSLLPGDTGADQGFFSQTVGGIPMWGLLAGGAVVLGGLAFALTRRAPAAPAAVKANRRHRVRRNRRHRRSY